MENWGFLKTDHGLLCTPYLRYSLFELLNYSFQIESIKYMNLGRISWLWIPIQIFEIPAILPWLPMMQLWAWIPLLSASFITMQIVDFHGTLIPVSIWSLRLPRSLSKMVQSSHFWTFSIKSAKSNPFSRFVLAAILKLSCVAAGPRTRLSHLYSPSAN